MTTTAIDILNMLVAAGIDREKAEPLAKELLTKAEAKDILATNVGLNEVKTEIKILTARVNILIGINTAIFVAVALQIISQLF